MFPLVLFGAVGLILALASWHGAFQRVHPDGHAGAAYLTIPSMIGVLVMALSIGLSEVSWVPLWVAYGILLLGIVLVNSHLVLDWLRPDRFVPDWEREQRAKLERIAEETGYYPEPVGGFMMPETPEELEQRRAEREALTAEAIAAEAAAIEHTLRRPQERRARRARRRRRV